MRERFFNVGFFLLCFGFYLRSVAPSVTTGDSGEFMTTAATLSLAHAPSYPLFSLMGRLFLDGMPWASAGFRLNVFSAFCSAGTLSLMSATARLLGVARWVSFLWALLFGVTTSFWLNSLVTEVFPLNTFFASLLLYLLVLFEKSQPSDQRRGGLQLAFVLGLGLGNHHILVFFVPILGFLILKRCPVEAWAKQILLCVLFGLLGFSVYLMLPIRSAKEPPLNWGQPTTLHKLYRTLARKDYGSFSLALGESPARNVKNTVHQLKRFGEQLADEIFWPVVLLMIVGFGLGFRENPAVFGSAGLLFLLSGPGFYLLANLPFNAQSDGIMGRFFILPAFALSFGLVPLFRFFKKGIPVALTAVLIASFMSTHAQASAHRSVRLVWDYGNALLRTLPPQAALFMDGGDDAFYSLAMLHYVENKRPDVALHDRGGLVFKNVYGDDFRRLPKNQKNARRHAVERQYLKNRDVLYSSMDQNVLPGSQLKQTGFLVQADPQRPVAMDWDHVVLRSLYPLQVDDYRSRALGAFFPFMLGKQQVESGQTQAGLAALYRSQIMGGDVDWLQSNLTYMYGVAAYNAVQANRLDEAETIYRRWMDFDPTNPQPFSNIGVVFERRGQWDKARQQYEDTMNRFPQESNAAYNLAVYHWHRQEWPRVIEVLQDVLRRNPNHPNARQYLAQAQRKIQQQVK